MQTIDEGNEYRGLHGNLKRALDKIYELEVQNEKNEKERTVALLENQTIKQENQRLLDEIKKRD